MRIIAGKHSGRRLLGPGREGVTRPITDRVKTSLFDRLDSAGRVEGAVVLDLFAGTGSMGIECLSRGAERVTFVERDRGAVDRLRRNLRAIEREAPARVLAMDVLGAGLIDALADAPYTLVFLDPPYALMRDEPRRHRLERQADRLAAVCAEGAAAVLRTEKQQPVGELERWSPAGSHTYGSMTLHLYQRP